MTTILMRQFGTTLTDRADGKKAFEEILRRGMFPLSLDFSGVVSLGSSFGDEVILKVAERQRNQLSVMNANRVIQNAVRRSAEDTSVTVSFSEP